MWRLITCHNMLDHMAPRDRSPYTYIRVNRIANISSGKLHSVTSDEGESVSQCFNISL